MKSISAISRFSIFLLVIFTTSVLSAQETNKSNVYIPEIGQQGKDVVWVPTPTELVNAMLKLANVTADDYVIDLGSGDGRTVIAAAKIGADALGIEYNPDMVKLSRENAEKEGVSSKATFIEADLYEYNFSKATVITMFLLPEINLKLRPRLLELKPGTRIVSNTFSMGEWDPDYEVTTQENWNSWNSALMWIVPAKIEGMWQLGKYELSLRQKFQLVLGNYITGEKVTAISDGRLSGSDITFRIGGDLYIGKVDGNKMTGTVTNESAKSDWTATKTGL